MTGSAEEWRLLLEGFATVFCHPSFMLFTRLATAWTMCPGRHTLTRVYQIAEPSQDKAHDAYHRFLREGSWRMGALWELVAKLLVNAFYPRDDILADLDDTVFHKTGRKVAQAAWWRDAVRSTGQRVVHCFGLNLVLLTLRVKAPWGGEPLGLPVNMRLHRKKGPTLLDLAEEMAREFAGWFPDRGIQLAADGFYAPLAGRAMPRLHLTSRMRRDAAIYEPAPKRRKGKRGRPRKRGRRLPPPEQLAGTKHGWSKVSVNIRGKPAMRLVLVRDVLWYAVCPERPVRLVISRAPDGSEQDDFFFTTDLSTTAQIVIGSYAGRWSIEDTFRNVKQLLGGQDPQTWKDQGPERAAAFSFWMYSIVWVWYVQTYGCRRSWIPLPWYPEKRSPSFADALAALRRSLWTERLFAHSDKHSLQRKMTTVIINVLATAA